jgi:hypothetical protein
LGPSCFGARRVSFALLPSFQDVDEMVSLKGKRMEPVYLGEIVVC